MFVYPHEPIQALPQVAKVYVATSRLVVLVLTSPLQGYYPNQGPPQNYGGGYPQRKHSFRLDPIFIP